MKGLALSIAITTLTLAQTGSEKKAEFEVASIRPAKQDGHHNIDTDSSRFQTHNASLKRLIALAYNIDVGQISGGPNWADSDGYDINAKIPDEFAENRTRDAVPQMVQSLLADRFQLVIHRDPREVSGYALVVAKRGSKMHPAKPDAQNSSMNSQNTRLIAENVTMGAFAKQLSRDRDIGKLVVDKTGLTGGFSFELDWARERLESRPEQPAEDHPSIFTALQEQLGLKLESAKVPISAIVIDRAEKPVGN
ncbi:MAG TPA: TIGR03435 family protein [Bryobacteraceae bacterium]|nr:TIGR03435 family protein [Bryobacteraceae bacterium]